MYYDKLNVIFIDYAGTLCTFHHSTDQDIEEKVKILADICHECDAKIVFTSGCKNAINEETLEIDHEAGGVLYLFYLFDKYNIEVYGRTPSVNKYSSNGVSFKEMWKEDEIRLFLMKHPEIEHYCVIDDDDLTALRKPSDLDKVRSHLVVTKDIDETNPDDEGLQPYHKEMIKEVLNKENDILHMIFRYRRYKYRQFKIEKKTLNKQ